MKLENYKASKLPHIPANLVDRVYITTTCELSSEELLAFSNVFHALGTELLQDKTINPNSYITVVCTDRDTISITMENPIELGTCLSLAVLPIHRWRAMRLNVLKMETCIAEELCHHFWNIRDERLVQTQVLSLLQIIHPSVQLSDVYNPNWKQDDCQC